jgi:hypothetical protein
VLFLAFSAQICYIGFTPAGWRGQWRFAQTVGQDDFYERGHDAKPPRDPETTNVLGGWMTTGLPNPSTGRCGERSPERSRRIVEPSGHRSIVYLNELVAVMPAAARAIFNHIFHLSVTTGQTVPPEI